jgi:organic radical activating enzyme
MPVSYSGLNPTTQWKELLILLKELQDYGFNFLIESFGSFCTPFHGAPVNYGERKNIFSGYKCKISLGYTTIPSGTKIKFPTESNFIYYFFAYMVSYDFHLFQNGKRINQVWQKEHKNALRDYNENHQFMKKRYLQENENGVLWSDDKNKRITLWNFKERKAPVQGKVFDLTEKQQIISENGAVHLKKNHTYMITEYKKDFTQIK